MNSALRNTLAFLAGFVALAVAKYAATALGNAIIPPPAAIPLYEARQWIPAFFEHAVGSMVGGAVAARLAASHHLKLALGIGALHMAGGIAAALMMPFPMWVVVIDLVAMYIPTAWLGGRLGSLA